MPSENDNAAERAQLNEADMEKSEALLPERRSDAREAMRANRAGKRKNALGGSAQVLDKARFGQGNPSFSLDYLWPGFAGFGSIWPNLDGAWIFLGCYPLPIGATDLILSSPPAGQHVSACS
jgi:hypothetical protein